jgi:DNA-binding CsgD family transcriptional regulator
LATLDETRLVGFIEAVFSLEIDDQEWLGQVLSALGALCGPEHHYRGFFYDASDIRDLKISSICAPNTSPELESAFAELAACAQPELVTNTFRSLPVGSFRRTALPYLAPILAKLELQGFADVFAINGVDPSGIGCMLLISSRAHELTPSASELQMFRRLAANLASAFRCRRKLGTLGSGSPSDRAPDVEAQERFAEIVSAAREQLRTAPPAADDAGAKRQARKAAPTFTHPATKAGLTLLHTFEENGRRYVVARENDASSQGVAALTQREREIVEHATNGFTNKQIAYNLGISNATVRVLMARAANRIGVRTRRELLAHPALQEIRPIAQPA